MHDEHGTRPRLDGTGEPLQPLAEIGLVPTLLVYAGSFPERSLQMRSPVLIIRSAKTWHDEMGITSSSLFRS